ncbi:MAG TPA: molybdate ABC transporter substrate-binding protein [Bacteroidales bacterium]|nr:molybdate ABC transporter substrate-binding protein [Bacteroidales bacterium]
MRKNFIYRVILFAILAASAGMSAGCGKTKSFTAVGAGKTSANKTAATVSLFAANGMSDAMEHVIEKYRETQPNVKISAVYDSSATLLTQIEEAGGCDIFISASPKQIDTLQEVDGLVVEGTRHNIVNNQLIVMTYSGSNTAVKGMATLSKATSLAIAAGFVPAGTYTRKALISLGILNKAEDPAQITTQQISKALGGVKVNECENVGACAQAVSEGSNEVATCYYSDYVRFTKQGFDLKVIEKVSQDLTGPIVFQVCRVKNAEGQELNIKAADDFLNYIISDKAKAIYQEYGFDTNVN